MLLIYLHVIRLALLHLASPQFADSILIRAAAQDSRKLLLPARSRIDARARSEPPIGARYVLSDSTMQK